MFGECSPKEAGTQWKCNEKRRLGNQVLRLTKTWLKVLGGREEIARFRNAIQK